ncbi:MAG TPA: cytochrome c [Rhodanobacteraceae bacterium]|nr:cytochrome c [Rhodanobacteraceae bacterium]
MRHGVLLAVLLALPAGMPGAAEPPPQHARTAPGPYPTIARGRYLTRIADCKACHTADNGVPFAGQRAVPTPFGTIYSTNITPDKTTGIGRYSDEDFWRAMHLGIDRTGRHMYPAFPYQFYSRMSRADVLSIKAYLDTLDPVRMENKPVELPWPMSMRWVMKVWNGMYFDPGVYQPDPHKSAQWNRGAYLVQGAGHCAACHSPKNMLGAPDLDNPLGGGMAENVFAPNLGNGKRDGLGLWTAADIAEYLHTGSNRWSAAAGPMAEVVQQSTQYLSQADVRAIATYLKDLPKQSDDSGDDEAPAHHIDEDVMARGKAVYVDNCEGCHMRDGRGLADVFPPLADTSAIQAAQAQTLIEAVLVGAQKPATRARPTGLRMPSFADKLDDGEIAAVITYIRNAWGNHASPASTGDVANLRSILRNGPPPQS